MPIRVLIADDHTLVRDGTRRILEQTGDIVVTGEAADGEEAIRKAADLRPDVALLDVSMPGMNGVDAARRIKVVSPETAILALTAYDDEPYVFALLEAGAAGYLLKNCRSDELVAGVRAVHIGQSALSPAIAQRVIARYFSPRQSEHKPSGGDELTDREREVLQLAAQGLTNKAIARSISLSPRTVQLHLGHAFRKLGVASRTEAVMAGVKQGWLRVRDKQ